MSEKGKNIMQYSNGGNSTKIQFVIYADTESLL